jgi:hypothetical protein
MNTMLNVYQTEEDILTGYTQVIPLVYTVPLLFILPKRYLENWIPFSQIHKRHKLTVFLICFSGIFADTIWRTSESRKEHL